MPSDKTKVFSKSQHQQQTISTIISYFQQDGTLNLEREYQRDVVWDNEHKQNFIESIVFYGITPNNIIFSADEDGIYNCIDGKQRLTSIWQYYNNQFPYYNSDENKYVYYSKFDKEQELEPENCRVMSSVEQRKFGNHNIPICIYEQLEYGDEVEIFHRIQFGVAPTKPETIISNIKDKKQAKTLKGLAEKHKDNLAKFSCAGRKGEINFIMLLLYATGTKEPKITPKNALKHLKDLSQNTSKFTKAIDECDKLMSNYLTDEVFMSGSINSKIFKNTLLMLFKFINVKKDKFNAYREKSPLKLISFINKVDDEVKKNADLPSSDLRKITRHESEANYNKISAIIEKAYRLKFYKQNPDKPILF